MEGSKYAGCSVKGNSRGCHHLKEDQGDCDCICMHEKTLGNLWQPISAGGKYYGKNKHK